MKLDIKIQEFIDWLEALNPKLTFARYDGCRCPIAGFLRHKGLLGEDCSVGVGSITKSDPYGREQPVDVADIPEWASQFIIDIDRGRENIIEAKYASLQAQSIRDMDDWLAKTGK